MMGLSELAELNNRAAEREAAERRRIRLQLLDELELALENRMVDDGTNDPHVDAEDIDAVLKAFREAA